MLRVGLLSKILVHGLDAIGGESAQDQLLGFVIEEREPDNETLQDLGLREKMLLTFVSESSSSNSVKLCVDGDSSNKFRFRHST